MWYDGFFSIKNQYSFMQYVRLSETYAKTNKHEGYEHFHLWNPQQGSILGRYLGLKLCLNTPFIIRWLWVIIPCTQLQILIFKFLSIAGLLSSPMNVCSLKLAFISANNGHFMLTIFGELRFLQDSTFFLSISMSPTLFDFRDSWM